MSEMNLPNIPGTNKAMIFNRISNTVEHWIISYFFQHEKTIEKGISITNHISKLEEILELPIGYHEKLKTYHEEFTRGYTKFLKEKYDKDLIETKPYTHPVDKVRTTNEGVDYISFTGGIGVRYLPLNESLQKLGNVYIDKKHPLTLIAPDKTIYQYWGASNFPGTRILKTTK